MNSFSNKTRTQNESWPHRVFSIGWYPYLLLRKAVTSSLSCSSWSWRVRASCSATSSWLHRLDWHPSWLSNACNSLACNQLLQGISRLGSSTIFTIRSLAFVICHGQIYLAYEVDTSRCYSLAVRSQRIFICLNIILFICINNVRLSNPFPLKWIHKCTFVEIYFIRV